MQAASIVACDFVTVESVFLRRYYALFFIAHGSRRVWLAGCTANPTWLWGASSGAMGRRPALAGTRLDVAQVAETVRHSDSSTQAAADYLSIPASWVRASVQYYADFPEEVDQWLERLRAIAEREEDAWRRMQTALA